MPATVPGSGDARVAYELMPDQAVTFAETRPSRRAMPLTLPLGLLLIAASEALLFVDVASRGGAVIPHDLPPADLTDPATPLDRVARRVAINVTPLCWVGYLLVADGVLTWLARRRNHPAISSIRARPNRFLVAWLTSIPVWCLFDWINFHLMDAWRYHGLPEPFTQRVVGYFIAFAAISPGMFLAAQLYQTLGTRGLIVTDRVARRRLAWAVPLGAAAVIVASLLVLLSRQDGALGTSRSLLAAALLLVGPPVASLVRQQSLVFTLFATGVGMTLWTLLASDPLSNLTLWVGLIFLLDPLNAQLGAPSLIRDWQAGRWGRTLALFAGGATCGLLWEFWNYWAIAKWTYHLPFLGPAEQWAYFEMPLLGFLGFLPFACECWVMLNCILGVLERFGLRLAEPLPDHHAVL